MRPGRPLAMFVLGASLCLADLLAAPVFAQVPGDAERGRALFTSKHCIRCHRPREERPATGPAVEELMGPQGAYELAGRLWNHAPGMFTALAAGGIPWPEISPAEMADLMAYLRAEPGRDPAPDLMRGQALLLGKGCLKCHRFRREGARVAGDLAERREDMAPPWAWASRMWAHTPRMAAVGLQRGIVYPRFTGAEMVNLLGFLRSGRGTP